MILVVDDTAIFREPIAACLRLHGHQTRVAADGQEALAIVCASPPQLILLDIAMPRMDGLSFLNALRLLPGCAAIPVILLSALSEKQCMAEAAKLNVLDYMLKSRFSLRDLIERVNKYVVHVPSASQARQR